MPYRCQNIPTTARRALLAAADYLVTLVQAQPRLEALALFALLLAALMSAINPA